MRLTILGCSGSVPGPDAPASGYLVEAGGFALGLELGNGTLAALQAIRDPFDLDAVLFSHLHPDHCADFSALAVYRRYHPEPRGQHKLDVYAPSEASARFANAYAPHESKRLRTDLTDVFSFHSLASTVSIGPFAVTAIPVDHPTESFGVRITHAGRTLAYTGDTGPCAALDDLARGADLLFSEATWTDAPDRPAGIHLSGRQAGSLARRAAAGRLLLTHIPPWADPAAILAEAEAEAEYPGTTELATMGATYDV